MGLEGTAPLAVGLLGPVVAHRDGRELPTGSRMQRAALAVLALSPGRAVPGPAMIAALWGDAPPATAAGTLRAYLSRLRGALGEGVVVRDAGGYRLDLPAAAVDATRFGAAVDTARRLLADDADGALEVVDEALRLWRGDALADVADLPFAGPAAVGLREQRRDAELLGWRARMLRGQHDAVLDDLLAASDRSPADEQVAGLAMVALYRAGRQGEALSRHADLRAHLADAVGIDPGPLVRRLHQAVLAQDPALMAGDPLALGAGTTGDTLLGDGPVDGPPPGRVAAAPDDRPGAPAPRRGNLPAPLSSFVGRESQLAMLDRLLTGARLVTVTGAGGVGKTRLALEATRRAGAHAEDGPWLVELGGVADGALVPASVAQALGVTTAGSTPEAALATAVHGRSTILLLDNCEHVIDAVAPLVAGLLGSCPDLRIVATSREPLGVPGEQVLVTPSLAPPDAQRLFLDRAALVAPPAAGGGEGGGAVDAAAVAQVQAICTALDGIPLAIELAAARLSALSLDHVSALMADRFALLAQGGAAAVPRHRTLAAAIAWSYDPLTDDERRVLHAAATFAGPFTLDALHELAGGDLTAVAVGLAALVDKSLISVMADAAADRRYRVLETIREYCDTQLDPEARRELAARHADWAVGLARRIAGRYIGEDPPYALAMAQRDDLRAALGRAEAQGDAGRMAVIAGSLGWAWFRLGQVAEGDRWLRRALELAVDREEEVAVADLVQVGIARSTLAYLGGDLEAAREAIGRAVAAARRVGDPLLVALSAAYLGYYHAAFGDPATAEELVGGPEDPDLPAWARAEIGMVRGQLRRAQGRVGAAVEELQRTQALAAEAGHGYIWGSCGWILSKLLLDLGRAEEAGRGLAEVIRRLADDGDRSSTLAGMHTMAAVAAPLGRLYEGAVLLGAVDALGARIGYHPLRMDPFDAPRQRALVTEALPEPVLRRAMAEGAGYRLPAALALAIAIGSAPGR